MGFQRNEDPEIREERYSLLEAMQGWNGDIPEETIGAEADLGNVPAEERQGAKGY